jgi:branched-chain amino acid transport system substrate-binding protein
MSRTLRRLLPVALVALLGAGPARAATAPAEIRIGTLYASSGRYASISMPVHYGLKLWADQMNAQGGVYVKAFDRKIPVKIVAYDDQSNTGTAATLYSQLITQDKVDLLVADSGSVLTSVAVPIARENKRLLIDQTGTGANFFTPDNPYIVLCDIAVSSMWPSYLSQFLNDQGPALGIKRVALLYATNNFTGGLASSVHKALTDAKKVEIVFEEGVPTETSNYNVLLAKIRAARPDFVIEFGYAPNDIAFLRNVFEGGHKFKGLFTTYSGLELDLLGKNVGAKGLEYNITFVSADRAHYPVNFGMNIDQFKAAWGKAYAGAHVEFGYNSIAGYNTGLIVEKGLGGAATFDQLEIRKAIFAQSGKLDTIAGHFELDANGAQIGMIPPVGQIVQEKGALEVKPIYPTAVAKPIYPRP